MQLCDFIFRVTIHPSFREIGEVQLQRHQSIFRGNSIMESDLQTVRTQATFRGPLPSSLLLLWEIRLCLSKMKPTSLPFATASR
jgi:hypothetical protein